MTGGEPPGSDLSRQIVRFGHGAAVVVFHGSVFPKHKLVRHVREVAVRHGVPYQLDILPSGGTDAGAIGRSKAAVPFTTISGTVHYVN